VPGSEPGLAIFQNVFPPILNFRGPKNVLASFEKPGIGCERVTIDGYMYVADKVLWVNAIK